jgi:hypothetical protein
MNTNAAAVAQVLWTVHIVVAPFDSFNLDRALTHNPPDCGTAASTLLVPHSSRHSINTRTSVELAQYARVPLELITGFVIERTWTDTVISIQGLNPNTVVQNGVIFKTPFHAAAFLPVTMLIQQRCRLHLTGSNNQKTKNHDS